MANESRTFKHLTYTDRLRIEKWYNKGVKPMDIAAKLRVHNSTIYRELERGKYEKLESATWILRKSYSADIAQEKYEKCKESKGPELKIGNDKEYAEFIEKTIIEKDYSPAAAVAVANEQGFETKVCVKTVYNYIGKGVFLNLTANQLPRGGKKKQKYKTVQKKKPSKAPAGESIEKRPEEIKTRETFGHWEGDTVYSGKGKQKSKNALLTMTERKTRKEIIVGIPNRQADTVVKAIDAIEKEWGTDNFRKIFQTITFDNGSEFAAADQLEMSCINQNEQRTKVFFAHPYSSFERGTNEVQNGMIRRKHPKGTDFNHVTDEELKATEEWMNNYPRRILGYSTSNKAFNAELLKLGIAV